MSDMKLRFRDAYRARRSFFQDAITALDLLFLGTGDADDVLTHFPVTGDRRIDKAVTIAVAANLPERWNKVASKVLRSNSERPKIFLGRLHRGQTGFGEWFRNTDKGR